MRPSLQYFLPPLSLLGGLDGFRVVQLLISEADHGIAVGPAAPPRRRIQKSRPVRAVEPEPVNSAQVAGLTATLARTTAAAVQMPVAVACEVVSRTPDVPVAVVAAAAAVRLVECPIAVGAAAGYVILRRWGPLRAHSPRP
jgi:hypothetical protein